jgi:hypothetical protein
VVDETAESVVGVARGASDSMDARGSASEEKQRRNMGAYVDLVLRVTHGNSKTETEISEITIQNHES